MSENDQLMFGHTMEQLRLLPITEQSNPITKDIDVASVQGKTYHYYDSDI